MVANVTTHVSAKKTKTGKERMVEIIEVTDRGTSLLLENSTAALRARDCRY
jgi:hypothetical protein